MMAPTYLLIVLASVYLHISLAFTSIQTYSDFGKMKHHSLASNAESTEILPETALQKATESLDVPLSYDVMVSQVSKAVKEANAAGITKQIIRILLPRDSGSADLGIFAESDPNEGIVNTILVPPDDTWQGGIMQLYRAAIPTCEDILKQAFVSTAGLPPRVTEDRSVDESGVDGVSLLTVKGASCFVQPLQETVVMVEDLAKKQQQTDEEIIMLINPQWRSVDDALDTVSNKEGLLGNLAAFLGGKGNSLKRLNELDFQSVYIIEGYVCKGGNIKLMKRFDSDWAVFAEKDDDAGYLRVGTSVDRPTYQDCDSMMDEMGISLKYARDIGLAPKL